MFVQNSGETVLRTFLLRGTGRAKALVLSLLLNPAIAKPLPPNTFAKGKPSPDFPGKREGLP